MYLSHLFKQHIHLDALSCPVGDHKLPTAPYYPSRPFQVQDDESSTHIYQVQKFSFHLIPPFQCECYVTQLLNQWLLRVAINFNLKEFVPELDDNLAETLVISTVKVNWMLGMAIFQGLKPDDLPMQLKHREQTSFTVKLQPTTPIAGELTLSDIMKSTQIQLGYHRTSVADSGATDHSVATNDSNWRFIWDEHMDSWVLSPVWREAQLPDPLIFYPHKENLLKHEKLRGVRVLFTRRWQSRPV